MRGPANRWPAQSGRRQPAQQPWAGSPPSTGRLPQNSPDSAGRKPADRAAKRELGRCDRTRGSADGKRLGIVPCHPPCSTPHDSIRTRNHTPLPTAANANAHSCSRLRSQIRLVMVPSNEGSSALFAASHRTASTLICQTVCGIVRFCRFVGRSLPAAHRWWLSEPAVRAYHAASAVGPRVALSRL